MINGCLRLIGMLAEGETPSSDTSNDCLVAMQQMIDSWSTESLSVFSTQEQVFTWPANQRLRTLGPTGDFVGNRPVGTLMDSTYYIANGISYNIELINQESYNAIARKTVTTTMPNLLYLNSSYPNVDLYIYPVPTQSLEFHFVSVAELDQPLTLATTLAFPPGYLRAFRFNLACEFGPEFGINVPADVKRIAIMSKRTLKRVNGPEDLMTFDSNLIGSGGSKFNVYSGQPF